MLNYHSLHWWIQIYLDVALVEYGQLLGRDQVRNFGKKVDLPVLIITRLLLVIAAVLWPATELVSLGMSWGGND